MFQKVFKLHSTHPHFFSHRPVVVRPGVEDQCLSLKNLLAHPSADQNPEASVVAGSNLKLQNSRWIKKCISKKEAAADPSKFLPISILKPSHLSTRRRQRLSNARFHHPHLLFPALADEARRRSSTGSHLRPASSHKAINPHARWLVIALAQITRV